MRFRIEEILKEKGKSKYWLFMQLGLSYQNLNKIINNQTTGIKFVTLQSLRNFRMYAERFICRIP